MNEFVINFYNRVLKEWNFNNKRIALLLGCTTYKPYSKSFMHKKIIRLIKHHNFDEIVQQYIIGEPLVVCPREWEEVYPAAHYDFPPHKLSEEGKKIFILRLRKFFEKSSNFYDSHVVFAPNHHRAIILEACKDLFEPIVVPYNLFNLPKLLKILNDIKVRLY